MFYELYAVQVMMYRTPFVGLSKHLAKYIQTFSAKHYWGKNVKVH